MQTLLRNIIPSLHPSFATSIKKYWQIYVSFLLITTCGLTLIWIFHNQVNPDGISYVQVARHYAELDLRVAVNGYWAPLLSWLMVPIIWLNIDPLIAYHAINFVLIILAISATFYLLNHGRMASTKEKSAQLAFVTTFGITMFRWSTSFVTPDILSGVLLLIVIWVLYRYLKQRSLSLSILLGTLLALLYFAKAVGFYVSLAIALGLIGVEFCQKRSIKSKNLVVLGVFLGLSAIWIGLISLKYNQLTISTASSYNFAIYGPEHPPHPQTIEGYTPVRHPNDIWGWDDPSYYKVPSWNIWDNPYYYFSHVVRNANDGLRLFFFCTPLIFLGLYGLLARKKDTELQATGYYLALVSILVAGIYSLIYIEERYLWFIAIPIVAFFGAIAIKQIKKNRRVLNVLLYMAMCSMLLTFFQMLQTGYATQLKYGSLRHLAEQSRRVLPAYAKVAGPTMHEYCYFSTTQCLGNYQLTADHERNEKLISIMRSKGIEYYIDFEQLNLTDLEAVYQGSSSQQTCYDYYKGKNYTCGLQTLTVYKL